MTDLDRLIEAVEAGLPSPTNWRNFAALTGETSDGEPFSILAHRAYHGSLDAAKRLHDALLPGWSWWIGHQTATPGEPETIFAHIWTEELRDGLWVKVAHEATSTDPARAWLLSILRAVKAKG